MMVVFLLWSTLVPTHKDYLSRSLLQPSSPWQPRPPYPPPPSSPPRSPCCSLARCPSFWWTLSTDLVLSWWKGAGTCIYSELSPLSTDAEVSIQNLLRHASSDIEYRAFWVLDIAAGCIRVNVSQGRLHRQGCTAHKDLVWAWVWVKTPSTKRKDRQWSLFGLPWGGIVFERGVVLWLVVLPLFQTGVVFLLSPVEGIVRQITFHEVRGCS